MKHIREVLLEITHTFKACQMLSPRRQAEDLVCDLLNMSRLQLYDQLDLPLSSQEWQTCQTWIKRRLLGEPLAYICGKIQFYGCSFEVNRSVLIPRQETELLVDKIVHSLKNQELTGKILWDLCTGSGCIGIAIKKIFPLLNIYLSDTSEEALALAARNARNNSVQVTCVRGDLLTPFRGKKAHYVICNPPYISENEYVILDKEVREYEPHSALVGGKTGLEFYERLACELPAYLHAQAQVWLEIGYQQGEAVQEIFSAPCWKKRRLENDWAGHHRFFFLENE